MPLSPFPQALFLSHGAPTLALDDSPARRFLQDLGRRTAPPRAVLVASAHYESASPAIGASAEPQTIHDFGRGFGPRLFALRYPAKGDPALARRAAEALTAAGLPARLDPGQGLDHGIWVPLLLLWPEAQVPVIPVAVLPEQDAGLHLKLGRALAPLAAEGVALIGSGAVTHDLGSVRLSGADQEEAGFARDFADWIDSALQADDPEALTGWQRTAPHAARNHPTPEHLLPLFTALGFAQGLGLDRVSRLHRSTSYGVLAMDAWGWAESAAAAA